MNGRAETLKAVLDDEEEEEEEEGGERAVRRRWWVWRREFCGWRGGVSCWSFGRSGERKGVSCKGLKWMLREQMGLLFFSMP